MAAIRKRGTAWRAEIVRTIDGKRIRISESFATKQQAQAWAIEKEAELLGIRRTGATHRLDADQSITLSETLERYRDQVTPTKRGAHWEKLRINLIIREFPELGSTRLPKLSPEILAKWRDKRLSQVSGSTVNREMNIISAVLEHARREWRLVASNPCRDVRRPPNPRHREQRISDVGRDTIAAALGFDGKPPTRKRQEVAIMFLVAVETGMRSGELVNLRWRDVQEHHLRITTSKNGDARDIPLSRSARELIGLMKGKNSDSVFSVGDRERDAIYRKYRPKEFDHIKFHDTRHEAVTRLSRKLDVLELARMIGHRDLKSLMVYYNPSPGELSQKLD